MSAMPSGIDPDRPIYPDVEVQLTGEDGNAFFIIGRTAKALRRHGVPADEVAAFQNEAMAGDYDNVLATVARWTSIA